MSFTVTSQDYLNLLELRSMPDQFKEKVKQNIVDKLDQSSHSLEDKMIKEVTCTLLDGMLNGDQKCDDGRLAKRLNNLLQSSKEADKIKLQMQLPKKHASQVDRLYRQKMSIQDKRQACMMSYIAGSNITRLNELEKELACGIDHISSSLSEAKRFQCHPKDLADALSKEADRIAAQLIEEEAQEKTKKNRRRAKPVPSQVTTSPPKVKQKPSQELEKQNSVIDVPISIESKEMRRAAFVQQLYQSSTHCVDLPRVRRWRIEDPEKIRRFTDMGKKGETILRYEHLSTAEILFQRAMHYLPGSERVWKSPIHREIYTFPTDRGAGVVSQLAFNQQKWNGVLYLGGDEKYHIFHRYFEDVKFADRKKNVFLDTRVELMEDTSDSGQSYSEEWECKDEFQVTLLENGALKFTYSANHSLTLYPLNKELLDQQLNA